MYVVCTYGIMHFIGDIVCDGICKSLLEASYPSLCETCVLKVSGDNVLGAIVMSSPSSCSLVILLCIVWLLWVD